MSDCVHLPPVTLMLLAGCRPALAVQTFANWQLTRQGGDLVWPCHHLPPPSISDTNRLFKICCFSSLLYMRITFTECPLSGSYNQSRPGLVWCDNDTSLSLSVSLSLYFHVSMLNKTENWRDSTGVLQHNVLVLIHLYTLWTLEIQSFDCCHYTSLKTGRHLPPPSVRSSLQILTNPRWRSSYSLCWPASSQTAKYTI